MATEGPLQVRVYDEHGRKRPYSEFKEAAEAAEMRPDQQIRLIHQRRSAKARIADESFRAVRTREMPHGRSLDGRIEGPRTVRWYYEAPNRRDIEGIDTTSAEYKRRRVERAKAAYVEGGLIEGVVEGADLGGRTAGKFASGTGEVVLDRSPSDREETLAHELGHALDYRLSGFRAHGFGHSEDAAEDEDFRADVREASVERRGEFHSSDEYRSRPTEQFADWFVGAVQEPRHTKATRGAPWESIEEKAREKGHERLEKLVETPLRAAKTDLYNAVFEASEDEGREADEQLFGKVDEAKRTIRKRFETEGHRERLQERVRARQDDLESFRASDATAFADLRIGSIHIEDDPLFEGSRRGDLIPEDVVRDLEDDLGQPLDIEGLN